MSRTEPPAAAEIDALYDAGGAWAWSLRDVGRRLLTRDDAHRRATKHREKHRGCTLCRWHPCPAVGP